MSLKQFTLVFFIITYSGFGFAGQKAKQCQPWQDKFSEQSLEEWDYQLNPEGISWLKDPVDDKSYVAQFTLSEQELWPNGHTRVELKHNACTTHEGDTTHVSFSFFLPELFKQANNIAYWESNRTYQQSMAFTIKPESNRNVLIFTTNYPNKAIQWQTDISVKKWYQLSMEVIWSQQSDKGRVTLWFDGKKELDQISVTTKADMQAMFIQLGLHRNAAFADVDRLYLKDITENND